MGLVLQQLCPSTARVIRTEQRTLMSREFQFPRRDGERRRHLAAMTIALCADMYTGTR